MGMHAHTDLESTLTHHSLKVHGYVWRCRHDRGCILLVQRFMVLST